jgi:hypothetical protein
MEFVACSCQFLAVDDPYKVSEAVISAGYEESKKHSVALALALYAVPVLLTEVIFFSRFLRAPNGELEMHSSAYYERITIVGYAFAILGILGLFGYVKLCYVFFREGERRKAVFWGAMII